MRCRGIRKLLPIYHDGDLPARTIEGIEKHLADCSDCRQEASEFDDALSVLRAVPKVRPAPEFKRAVMAAVRRESVRARQGLLERVLVWQPVLATAGVAACILVGALAIWHYGRQTTPGVPIASDSGVERTIVDKSPEVSPTLVEVAPVQDPAPPAEAVVYRRPRRERPITVAMGSPVSVRRPAPAEPAPKEVAPKAVDETAEAASAPRRGIIRTAIGDLVLGTVLASVRAPERADELLPLTTGVPGSAVLSIREEPAGTTGTEADPTTL